MRRDNQAFKRVKEKNAYFNVGVINAISCNNQEHVDEIFHLIGTVRAK